MYLCMYDHLLNAMHQRVKGKFHRLSSVSRESTEATAILKLKLDGCFGGSILKRL